MCVVRDLRILNAIGKRYNLKFDKKFKYCVEDNNHFGGLYYKNKQYRLVYFPGCFYPFLAKIN